MAPDSRRRIDRILLLSGGGLLQTFFSVGAIKCLVDNGMFYDREGDAFYFDVISAVSGGTMVLSLIDFATNPQVAYHRRDDWYNLYVRAPLYRMSRDMGSALIWGSLSGDLERRFLGLLPEYEWALVKLTENTNIACRYNYVDAATGFVSSDHSDLFDPSQNVRAPLWWWKRAFRCSLPWTVLGGKGAYDAGATSNLPIASALKEFRPRDTFVIFANPHLLYDRSPQPSWLELGFSSLWGALAGVSSNVAINGLLDLMIDKSGRNLCCSMPNDLNDSDDANHRGIVTSVDRDVSLVVRMYNGALFHDAASLKLIENIGYTQMHAQIAEYCRGGRRKCVFAIPNPDVYDKERAARIYERLRTINPIYETIVSTIGSSIKPHLDLAP
jgi:hypothetical protein